MGDMSASSSSSTDKSDKKTSTTTAAAVVKAFAPAPNTKPKEKGVRPEERKRTMTSAEVLNLIRDVQLPRSTGVAKTMSTVHEDDVKLDIVSTASPLRKSSRSNKQGLGSSSGKLELDNLRKSTESVKSNGGAADMRRSTDSVLSKKSSIGGRSPTLDPLLGTVDECLAHAICVEQPDSDGDEDD